MKNLNDTLVWSSSVSDASQKRFSPPTLLRSVANRKRLSEDARPLYLNRARGLLVARRGAQGVRARAPRAQLPKYLRAPLALFLDPLDHLLSALSRGERQAIGQLKLDALAVP